MFGIGVWELVIIGVLGVVVFVPIAVVIVVAIVASQSQNKKPPM